MKSSNYTRQNNKYLLLLESEKEHKAYKLNKKSFVDHDLTVCCLSVDAIRYCEVNNIKFILPEDSFSEDEQNQYREISENKVKKLVEKLNSYFHEKISGKDEFKFDVGNYHYFMLYHFFGALHYRSFILSRIIAKYNPDQILVGRDPSIVIKERPFPVSQYPNNYFELCMQSSLKGKVIPLDINIMTNNCRNNRGFNIRPFIAKVLRKFPIFYEFWYAKKNNIQLSIYRKLFNKSKLEVLMVGGMYNWKHVFQDPRLRKKIDVFQCNDDVVIPQDMVKNWFLEWFEWEDNFCGFDVAALGKYEMGRIKALSDKLIKVHSKIKRRLKQYKCIVYSSSPYYGEQHLLSAGKTLNIPRVCYQHGEMSLYYPGLWNEASELQYISHYLSFGDQVSLEKGNSASKVDGFAGAISVGSASIDALRAKSNEDASYIFYASSKYLSYAGGFAPRYVDLNVMKCQSLLIDYFEKQIKNGQNISVIWKLNPECMTTQPHIVAHKVKVISDDSKFTDLLSRAQMVILDRPSTTALEACMTEKPIFTLLSNRNWYQLPENLLRKRAVVAYTPKELVDSVDRYLTDGYYPADVKNREFLNAYGVHYDDGKSAQRAADELIKIMDRKEI